MQTKMRNYLGLLRFPWLLFMRKIFTHKTMNENTCATFFKRGLE